MKKAPRRHIIFNPVDVQDKSSHRKPHTTHGETSQATAELAWDTAETEDKGPTTWSKDSSRQRKTRQFTTHRPAGQEMLK